MEEIGLHYDVFQKLVLSTIDFTGLRLGSLPGLRLSHRYRVSIK